jgi:metal-responsive CopG/Arc/MetJ family transcriptional regulator
MKTAISIPDDVFAAAEAAAQSLSVSRSEFYTKAIERYLQDQKDAAITDCLNEVYASNSSELDPALYEIMLRSIGDEQW